MGRIGFTYVCKSIPSSHIPNLTHIRSLSRREIGSYKFLKCHHHYHHLAISAHIPDPLSPLLPNFHCFRQVFRVTSPISTELLYVGSSWSSCLCLSVWRGSQEYIPYEFVPTSPAVFRMLGSSNLDSFRDGGGLAVQLLLCGVLPPGLIQYCSQHSCVVSSKLFFHTFS